MVIGYARVSTWDQGIDVQVEILRERGCERVFKETKSGAKRDRAELKRMIEHLRPGDTAMVWRLDRLARSTRDLLELVEAIGKTGAGFQSVCEPWADTTTPGGKMILTVFGGIAEFERDLIRERTRVGRVAAKKRGVRFGRPEKMNEDQVKLMKRLLREGKSVSEVARTFGVHRTTVYRNAGEMSV